MSTLKHLINMNNNYTNRLKDTVSNLMQHRSVIYVLSYQIQYNTQNLYPHDQSGKESQNWYIVDGVKQREGININIYRYTSYIIDTDNAMIKYIDSYNNSSTSQCIDNVIRMHYPSIIDIFDKQLNGYICPSSGYQHHNITFQRPKVQHIIQYSGYLLCQNSKDIVLIEGPIYDFNDVGSIRELYDAIMYNKLPDRILMIDYNLNCEQFITSSGNESNKPLMTFALNRFVNQSDNTSTDEDQEVLYTEFQIKIPKIQHNKSSIVIVILIIIICCMSMWMWMLK